MKAFYVIALLLTAPFFQPLYAQAAEKESAYERVMRTGTIRCGYWSYEPFVSVDPASGEVGGVTHDYLDILAKREGLTIDWAGEVGFDQIVSSLESGRFDAFCIPCTPAPEFERVLGFSAPLGALPYFVYVREDSKLGDEELKTATFTVADGYALSEMTGLLFPDAPTISLPQNASSAEMYDQLRYGKADAILNENISATNYMNSNPGVIRHFSDTPVISMRMFLVSPKSDLEMQAFLERTFSTQIPENLSLMKDLLKEYGVEESSLLLGDECRNPHENEKQWKVCD